MNKCSHLAPKAWRRQYQPDLMEIWSGGVSGSVNKCGSVDKSVEIDGTVPNHPGVSLIIYIDSSPAGTF